MRRISIAIIKGSKLQDAIVFFNVETGEREVIASKFADWINVIQDDLEYFTGINVLENWIATNKLDINQRLCPKAFYNGRRV
jgi:hypothetical protein